MKKFLTLLLLVIITSCKIDGPSSSDVVKTGDAEVSEQSVIIYGYLNIDPSVRNTCQFGILYSKDPKPSKDNGTYSTSSELDSQNKYKVAIYGLSSDTEYYYSAYVRYESGSYQYGEIKSFKTKLKIFPVPDLVDLGLSVKWATCNLGASKPEEYGGYYQWAGLADVSDKSIYLDLSNCPYHIGSSSSTGWTKYVPSNKSSYWSGSGSPDNKRVLDPEDDVAHVKLGGRWRMPTYAEWQELIDNCTSVWTTLNGVEGTKFTSKKNGNSIFLPAAGYRTGSTLGHAGSFGNYWSSSLYTDDPTYAYYPYFYSGYVGRYYSSRCLGQSVRPVSE